MSWVILKPMDATERERFVQNARVLRQKFLVPDWETINYGKDSLTCSPAGYIGYNGPVRQPYAIVDFIPAVRDYVFCLFKGTQD